MKLRLSLTDRPILTILVIAMLGVGLACAGEKATPTSPPTATAAPTATTAPTATLVPTATATLVPGAPTPTATAIPTATATTVPTATATAVPLTWIQKYMQSAGYKREWGQPQTGGILKLRVARNPGSLNPIEGLSGDGPFYMPFYNSLISFDPWVGQSSVTPDLAKSWEMSGDGLHLTLKLEEGVKFQDNPKIPERLRNADFTCEDVQASIERFVRPPKWEIKIILGKAMLGHLNSVSCPDGPRGYTAVLSFDLPLAKTMPSLAIGYTLMMDKEWIEWLNTEHPGELAKPTPGNYLWHTGTGPFAPVEFQPDVIGRVRRNPTYWREGLPLVDGMDLYILKDSTTAFTALATGNIHYLGQGAWALLPGQVAQAERDFKDRIVVHPALHAFGRGVKFNMGRDPFNDRRVRTAIHLAMDRDDWLLFKKAGSYDGAVLMGGFLPRSYWSHTEAEYRTWPGIRQPKDQDIAEANRLLDEVFGKGKRFKTSCSNYTLQDYVDLCLFFIDQMKRHLSIDVTMDFYENAVWSERSASCLYDISGGAMAPTNIGDPDDYFFRREHRRYATDRADTCRLAGVYAAEPVLQEELEALMAAQSIEMDPVKRREITRVLDWRLTQEMIYMVQFGWGMSFIGTTPKLKGFYLVDYAAYSGFHVWERVWLAK